ncbi:MAG: glycosyltransferase family 2 protein [Solirubrobacterales bacterium]
MPPADMPQITVIVATKGRPDALAETLENVARCDPAPAAVLVVDGDEHRSALAVVEASGLPGARHIASDPGLPHQRNVGLRQSGSAITCFLDDDVIVEPDILGHLAAVYADPAVVGATGTVNEPATGRAGGAGSALRDLVQRGGPEGTMTSFGYPRRLGPGAAPAQVEFMPGCLMSARTEVARRVGFDEHLPGYALAEDEDFSYRLSREGAIALVPQARLFHKSYGVLRSRQRAFNRQLVVNRTYLFRKNFEQTWRARAGFAGLMAVLIAHRLLNREWQGIAGLADGFRDVAAGRL